MYAARSGNIIAVRLAQGADVHSALCAICRTHGIKAAFVVSGIGMLADPELGFFVSRGQYARQAFAGRHELLNLSGNISEYQGELTPHLHAMLAYEDYSVFGGHLSQAKVGLTLEVMLAVVGDPVRMRRELEEETGLTGLLIE